jgi:hypothetical protein
MIGERKQKSGSAIGSALGIVGNPQKTLENAIDYFAVSGST